MYLSFEVREKIWKVREKELGGNPVKLFKMDTHDILHFFQVNDIVMVLETTMNGSWRGELKGKVGEFPFTHVQWLDDDNE